jgi:hypothetical protein
MTPLHDAVLRSTSGDRGVRLDVVRQLVAAGARTDLENFAGETALALARRLGNSEVLALLGSTA